MTVLGHQISLRAMLQPGGRRNWIKMNKEISALRKYSLKRKSSPIIKI
jgi:hypothetical protein